MYSAVPRSMPGPWSRRPGTGVPRSRESCHHATAGTGRGHREVDRCARLRAAGSRTGARGRRAGDVRGPADRGLRPARRGGGRRRRCRRRDRARGGARRGRLRLLRPAGAVGHAGPAGQRGGASRALPAGAGAEQGRAAAGAAAVPVAGRAAELLHRRPRPALRRDLLHRGPAPRARRGRTARRARARARARVRPRRPGLVAVRGLGHRDHLPGQPGPVRPARLGQPGARDRWVCSSTR